MRLGLTELLLILLIALLAFGPGVSRWMNRWSRQAQAAHAEEARRRAAREAQRQARRAYILHRFQIVAAVFPIEAEPRSYTLPAAAEQAAAHTVTETAALPLEGYLAPDGVAVRDGWLYMAARPAAVMRYSFLRLSPAPSIGSIQPFSIRPDKAPYIVPADMRRRPRLIASTCCMMA